MGQRSDAANCKTDQDVSPSSTRNPLLLLRLSGVLLLRFAERKFVALLFHEPPRNTRSGAPRLQPPRRVRQT